MTDLIESAILERLKAAPAGKSISPSDVAKALEPGQWRRLLPKIRAAAADLAREGRLVITRKGKPVDPNAFKGVIRLKPPDAPGEHDPD